jgi:hypothetical protein
VTYVCGLGDAVMVSVPTPAALSLPPTTTPTGNGGGYINGLLTWTNPYAALLGLTLTPTVLGMPSRTSTDVETLLGLWTPPLALAIFLLLRSN